MGSAVNGLTYKAGYCFSAAHHQVYQTRNDKFRSDLTSTESAYNLTTTGHILIQLHTVGPNVLVQVK